MCIITNMSNGRNLIKADPFLKDYTTNNLLIAIPLPWGGYTQAHTHSCICTNVVNKSNFKNQVHAGHKQEQTLIKNLIIVKFEYFEQCTYYVHVNDNYGIDDNA